MSKILKKSFIIVLIIILCSDIHFADEPGAISENDNIAVIGDSFAGYFTRYEFSDNLKSYIFPVGQLTDFLNINLFNRCIDDESVKYILYCTGVNDVALETDIGQFENCLREHIEKIRSRGKYLFFHSYMIVPDLDTNEIGLTVDDYDNVLIKLADEFDDVYYIDMKEFNDIKYMQSDKMHFDIEFYDTLNVKLTDKIDNIRSEIYGYINPWDMISRREELAITGDSFAELFYKIENDKKIFKLYLFASSENTITENENLIFSALNSTAKYVLLNIGPNDYKRRTSLYHFESELRKFANSSLTNHKILFFHSYMGFDIDDKIFPDFHDYDLILKKIANSYPNIYYLDTNEYQLGEYIEDDNFHYGKIFYDALYIKLCETINGIV